MQNKEKNIIYHRKGISVFFVEFEKQLLLKIINNSNLNVLDDFDKGNVSTIINRINSQNKPLFSSRERYVLELLITRYKDGDFTNKEKFYYRRLKEKIIGKYVSFSNGRSYEEV